MGAEGRLHMVDHGSTELMGVLPGIMPVERLEDIRWAFSRKREN